MGQEEDVYAEKQRKKLLKVRWKIIPCFAEEQGEDCWCGVVVPENPLYWDKEKKKEMDVIPYGAVSKQVAAHIVKTHNNSISKKRS